MIPVFTIRDKNILSSKIEIYLYRIINSFILSSLILLFLTGILIAMWYYPTEEMAYYSILFIRNNVYFGDTLLIIHRISSDILIIATILHILLTIRRCNTGSWLSGILMFYVLILFIFTGYLMRWDYVGYTSVKIASNILRDLPFIGEYLKKILLFGDDISSITLLRYYVLHVLILPAILAYLFKRHISEEFLKLEENLGLILISMGIILNLSLLYTYEEPIEIQEGKDIVKPYWLFLWLYYIDYKIGNVNPDFNFIPGLILIALAIYILIFPYIKKRNTKYSYLSLFLILLILFVLSILSLLISFNTTSTT